MRSDAAVQEMSVQRPVPPQTGPRFVVRLSDDREFDSSNTTAAFTAAADVCPACSVRVVL
jgi:hypothetical protein